MAENVPAGLTFQSMAEAGAPGASKMRAWYNRTLANGSDSQASKIALAKLHVKAAGEGLRAGGESLLVGGVLGAVHAQLPGGLDFKKVPMDAVAGVMGLAAGAIGAQMEVGKDLQNAGAACLAIYGFRKTNDLIVEAKLKASGFTPGGGAARPAGIGFPISKPFGQAGINGENGFGSDSFGWAPGSTRQRGEGFPVGVSGSDMGEDPIATAARGL